MSASASANPCTSKDGDPVTWFTFYSHREKREYYYEPISGTTTWIAPSRTHGVISHLPGSPDEESNSNADVSLYQRKVLPFITRPTVAVSMFLFNLMLLFVWLKTGYSGIALQTMDASAWTPPLREEVESHHDQSLPSDDFSVVMFAISNDQEDEESLKMLPARSLPVLQPLEPMTTVGDTDETPAESADDDTVMVSKHPDSTDPTTLASIEDDETHPVAIDDGDRDDTLQAAAEEMDHHAFDEVEEANKVHEVDSFEKHYGVAMQKRVENVDATESIVSKGDDFSIPNVGDAGSSLLSELGEDNKKPGEVNHFDAVEETSGESPVATVPNDELIPEVHVLHDEVTISDSHDTESEEEVTDALGVELPWTESDILLEKVLTNAIIAGFTIDREPVAHHEVVLRPLEEIVSKAEGGSERNSLCGNRMAKLLLPHCRDEHVSLS